MKLKLLIVVGAAGIVLNHTQAQQTMPSDKTALQQKLLQQKTREALLLDQKANQGIDPLLLPGFELKAPVKDTRRLQLIPLRAPTFIEMTDAIKATKKKLEAVLPKTMVEEVKTIAAQQNPAQLEKTALAAFYNEQQAAALLMELHGALTWPDDVAPWNNLAAMMNMSGLEHKAIPVLMHLLEKEPNNSILLNNMGQAYLGLGDMNTAASFLQKCLEADPMHPEANRSMGIIRYIQKQYDEGSAYFEKELEIAYRQSSMALLRSKNKAANIYQLRKKRGSLPHKDFFDEIQLGKFRMPDFPHSSAEVKEASSKLESFLASVTGEMLYWKEKSIADKKVLAAEKDIYPGQYHYYVEALLDDLHKVYTAHELTLFDDIHSNHISNIIESYYAAITAVQCEPAPANATIQLLQAYELKCCLRKKDIHEQFLHQYNSYVQMRINAIAPVWKAYLNDLISIVSLCPTPANKRFVSSKLYEYFTWLGTAAQAAQMTAYNCSPDLTAAAADSLITSARQLELSCPGWLNFEYDMQFGKIKADCNKVELEGSGALLTGGYEHNFRKGTSTLSFGAGFKTKFFDGASGADLKAMAYLSFDSKSFTDIGLVTKGQVKLAANPFHTADNVIKLGGTIAGIEATGTIGLSSGFNSSIKGKGLLADFIQYDTRSH